MMSLWDALRMNMMISYQELVRTFPNSAAFITWYFVDCAVAFIVSPVSVYIYFIS